MIITAGTCINWFFRLLQMKFYIMGYSISFFSIGILAFVGVIAGIILKGILTIFRGLF